MAVPITPRVPSSGRGFKKPPIAGAKKATGVLKSIPKVRTGLAGAAAKTAKAAVKAGSKTVKGTTAAGTAAGSGTAASNFVGGLASSAAKKASAVAKKASGAALKAAGKAAVKGGMRLAQACAASGVCLVCVVVASAVVGVLMLVSLAVLVSGEDSWVMSSSGGIGGGGSSGALPAALGLASTELDAVSLLSSSASAELLGLLRWAPERSLGAHDVDVVVRLLGGGPVRVRVRGAGSGSHTEAACGYLSAEVSEVSPGTEVSVGSTDVIEGGTSGGFYLPADACHALAAAHSVYAAAAARFESYDDIPELFGRYVSAAVKSDSRGCSADPECRVSLFLGGSGEPVKVPVPAGSVSAFGLAVIAATHPVTGDAPILPAYLRPAEGGATAECYEGSTVAQSSVDLPSGVAVGVLHMKCPPYLTALGSESSPAMEAVRRLLPCLPDRVVGRQEYDDYEGYEGYDGSVRTEHASLSARPEFFLAGSEPEPCSVLDMLESSETVNRLRELEPAHRPRPGVVLWLLGASDGLLNALGVAYDMSPPDGYAVHEPSMTRDMAWHMSDSSEAPVALTGVQRALTAHENGHPGGPYPVALPDSETGGTVRVKPLLGEGGWQKVSDLWLSAHQSSPADYRSGPPGCHWLPALWDCGQDSTMGSSFLRAVGWGPPESRNELHSDVSANRVDCRLRSPRPARTLNGVTHLPGVILGFGDAEADAHELHLLPLELNSWRRAWVHRCIFDDVVVLLSLGRVGMSPDLSVGSGGGWRSHQRQIALRYANCGGVVFSAGAACSPPTASPGRSRHQIGMAVDFSYCSTSESVCYRWLNRMGVASPLFPLCGRSGTKGASCDIVVDDHPRWLKEAWHWSVDGR